MILRWFLRSQNHDIPEGRTNVGGLVTGNRMPVSRFFFRNRSTLRRCQRYLPLQSVSDLLIEFRGNFSDIAFFIRSCIMLMCVSCLKWPLQLVPLRNQVCIQCMFHPFLSFALSLMGLQKSKSDLNANAIGSQPCDHSFVLF